MVRGSKNHSDRNKGGRPSPYNKSIPNRAYKLTLLKLTDKELGIAFGVTEATINNWKNEHPEFLESIKRGKWEADGEIVASMVKRANGYEWEKVEVTSLDNGNLITKRTTMHVPSEAVAGIFLLNNRTRKNEDPWVNSHRQEHTGKDGGPIEIREKVDLADFTKEELEMMDKYGLSIKGLVTSDDRTRN